MNENNPLEEIVLLTDRDWSIIDSEVCKVSDFTPWGHIKDGKVSTFDFMRLLR